MVVVLVTWFWWCGHMIVFLSALQLLLSQEFEHPTHLLLSSLHHCILSSDRHAILRGQYMWDLHMHDRRLWHLSLSLSLSLSAFPSSYLTGLEALGGLAWCSHNEAPIASTTPHEIYHRMVELLLVADCQLILMSLDSMYNLTFYGKEIGREVLVASHSVDVLLTLLRFRVEQLPAVAVEGVVLVHPNGRMEVPSISSGSGTGQNKVTSLPQQTNQIQTQVGSGCGGNTVQSSSQLKPQQQQQKLTTTSSPSSSSSTSPLSTAQLAPTTPQRHNKISSPLNLLTDRTTSTMKLPVSSLHGSFTNNTQVPHRVQPKDVFAIEWWGRTRNNYAV